MKPVSPILSVFTPYFTTQKKMDSFLNESPLMNSFSSFQTTLFQLPSTQDVLVHCMANYTISN